MRSITKHIIHCSDSNFGDAKTIDEWHKRRGWKGIGYHFVILQDGRIEMGRCIKNAGAHAKGHNRDSIGTCLIGKSDFTKAQFSSLIQLHKTLRLIFPCITVLPHKAVNPNKTCPNFNVYEVMGDEV